MVALKERHVAGVAIREPELRRTAWEFVELVEYCQHLYEAGALRLPNPFAVVLYQPPRHPIQ